MGDVTRDGAASKLPILADNTDLVELMSALREEVEELDTEITKLVVGGRIPDRDNAGRETLDVIQLCIGILVAIEWDYNADVPELMEEHVDKLLGRGWEIESYIGVDWPEKGDGE